MIRFRSLFIFVWFSAAVRLVSIHFLSCFALARCARTASAASNHRKLFFLCLNRICVLCFLSIHSFFNNSQNICNILSNEASRRVAYPHKQGQLWASIICPGRIQPQNFFATIPQNFFAQEFCFVRIYKFLFANFVSSSLTNHSLRQIFF